MRNVAALLALALLALTASMSAQQPLEGWSDVTQFFREGVKREGIVGASLAWIKDGQIEALETTGLADRASGAPVTRDTIYHWASITKTFTAVAIMQLRDQGKLTLDDPIVDYVPELALVHNPHGRMRDITIRHLLSHSAGFRGGTWPWGGDKPWHPFEPPAWEQVAAMMPYTEILFPPGTRYSYSNPGIIFLGRVIEHLSGEPFESYIDKQILRPLGMRDTFFDRAPASTRAFRSHSYYLNDGTLAEAPFDFDTGITVSNGGLNAPIIDLAKWIAFLIGRPTPFAAGGADYDAVLKRSSLEEMFKPIVPVVAGGPGEQGVGTGAMGLSFFLETHGGVDLIAHSGSQNGFITHFYMHLPSGSAYIVAFNTETPTTRAFDAALRDEVVKKIWRKR